jgi:hypothetical protein
LNALFEGRFFLNLTMFSALFRFVLIAFLMQSASIQAQPSFLRLTVSNNGTGLPVTGVPDLFHAQFHPGIDLSARYPLQKTERPHWTIDASAGYVYHRFVHHLIRAAPSLNYHLFLSKLFTAEISILAGTAITFGEKQYFTLSGNGTYRQSSSLRWQYLGGFGLSLEWQPKAESKHRYFIKSCSFLAGPFVQGYVPVLPVNSIFIGFSKSFTRNERLH